MKVSIKDIKPNPNNPRLVKDDKFAKLVQSIKDFPQMLDIRPIVVNKDMIVLGGNMRLKACKEAGLKEIPIIKAEDLTEEQQREFIIKDNVGYGEWDWQLIAKEWDTEKLNDWGLDIPDFAIAPTEDELIGDEKNKPPTMKLTFESVEDLQQAEIDITELIDRKYPKAYFSVSAGEL
jgi:ParB-like chromosome segregation protein Spo0J